MEREIKLVFHNQGLRSYIEVDLCSQCPRQDDKGCCGYYSPVFYPLDLAYILINQPDLIDYIFNLEHITVLDASVTVNNSIDDKSYRCRFHQKEGGCLLSQNLRESICRHFVCPGIGWWEEKKLKSWQEFFDRLGEYEIELNNRLAERLHEQGLTLRNPAQRNKFLSELLNMYAEELAIQPNFITAMPIQEECTIIRPLMYGLDWPL